MLWYNKVIYKFILMLYQKKAEDFRFHHFSLKCKYFFSYQFE
ncbi:MAG: hypothetical protein BAJALOKI1v1_240028 [Promethearchaeota archaeon]|nr:MAG: hypothetical protein BAJALOKI1v1_240028 [Candidatus Lokiarchaeota archaeon]